MGQSGRSGGQRGVNPSWGSGSIANWVGFLFFVFVFFLEGADLASLPSEDNFGPLTPFVLCPWQ
jgi:hypothetical protein